MTLVKFHRLPVRPAFTGNDRIYSRPAVNVLETPSGYRIELAAPGLVREDFDIQLEDDVLHVRAKASSGNEEQTNTLIRREFDFKSFEISFRIPETIDGQQIGAAYKNGILTIDLALKPEVKPVVRKVEIA